MQPQNQPEKAIRRVVASALVGATIEWYRGNEAWWGPLKEQVEAAYAARGQ